MKKNLTFLLAFYSSLIFSATNQDVIDRLDELQFEMDMQQLMRNQNSRPLPVAPPIRTQFYILGTDTLGDTYSIDTNSIKKLKNGNIQVTDFTDGDKPKYIADTTYFGTMGLVEINCYSNQSRKIKDNLYTKNTKLIKTITYKSEFININQNSMMQLYKNYLCR